MHYSNLKKIASPCLRCKFEEEIRRFLRDMFITKVSYGTVESCIVIFNIFGMCEVGGTRCNPPPLPPSFLCIWTTAYLEGQLKSLEESKSALVTGNLIGQM